MLASLGNGINVLQSDLESGLAGFDDASFDCVILSQTLQAMRHTEGIVNEMLRVGRDAIVTFPNFGHWTHRLQILHGRMPVSSALPYQWYDTPNIHLCTVARFRRVSRRAALRRGESRRAGSAAGTVTGCCRMLLGELAIYRFRRYVAPAALPVPNRAPRWVHARRSDCRSARRWREALFNRRMLICVFTGFSSGLPLYLLINLIPAWLRSEHVDLKTIGLFTLIQLPYTWKFLWSPLLDRYAFPVLGRRRGWMLVTQLLLLATIPLFGASSRSRTRGPSPISPPPSRSSARARTSCSTPIAARYCRTRSSASATPSTSTPTGSRAWCPARWR